MTYLLRWRDDADGFVKHLAGKTMHGVEFRTLGDAEEVRRAMPNGHHVEIVEVAG